MGNLSLEQLRHKIYLRLFFSKLALQKTVAIQEWRFNTMLFANKILREEGFEDVLARLRGQRLFLVYKPTHKIICEVGLDGYNIMFVSLKGIMPNNLSLQEIIARKARK